MKQAQSGDILLFDNPARCNVCLINCFTRSDWDHVAMVVKKPGGTLAETYLLEVPTSINYYHIWTEFLK